MKYKIKITTYTNGRKEFNCYVKKKGFFQGWKGLDVNGKASYSWSFTSHTRKYALEIIDRHIEGNCEVKDIRFEYL